VQKSTSQTWSNVQFIQEKALPFYPILHFCTHSTTLCLVYLSSLSLVTLFSVSRRSDEKTRVDYESQSRHTAWGQSINKPDSKVSHRKDLCVQIQPGRGQKEEICAVVSELASDNAWNMGQTGEEQCVERLKLGNNENVSVRETAYPPRVSFWMNIKLQ